MLLLVHRKKVSTVSEEAAVVSKDGNVALILVVVPQLVVSNP